MTGRSGLVAFAVLALAFTGCCAGRAILSVQGGAQYDIESVHQAHRQLMSGLKAAQVEAGIDVDDEALFTHSASRSGRQLRQTDVGSVLTNPSVLASLMTMFSQGLTVGAFPGAALNLPGGSPFGYAPTDDSYCLFATQPYSGAPSPDTFRPFEMLAPAGSEPVALPGAFACVEASSNPPYSSMGFPVSYGGKEYVCQGSPNTPPPSGRRLLQDAAPSPADIAIGNALAAIGIPIWNCVVATTPKGNTTLGQAAGAIINDLGVIAEHLLVYLNADGQLTYEQNVKNNFVSLANPLYPSGPRLNVSIDFATVTKDVPILNEIFRQPAPPSPVPPPVATTVTTPTGTTTTTTSEGSAASGGSATGSGDSGASSGASASAGSSSAGGSTAVGGPTGSVAVQTPQGAVTVPTPAPVMVPLAAFDGYLDNCQTVVGSTPHTDGNFDRTNNFTTVISDGVSNMTAASVNSFAGQVAYVIPASKAVEYTPLTLATRKQAQFCYDIATLQPVYNPLATFITANATGLAASPASTVATFGQAFGLTPEFFVQAMCLNLPAGQTLSSFDALRAATGGDAVGLAVLKTNVQIANLVTAASNLLTNDTTTYASFAIIVDQAIARQVLSLQSATGRKLLQAPAPSAGCAINLANATTVGSIITLAQQSVPTQADEATRTALNPITTTQIAGVAEAVANLNAAVANAPDATATELGQYYAETQLAPQVGQLATGGVTEEQFMSETSPSAISTALAGQALPGQLLPAAVPSPATTVTPVTQSSTTTTSSSSGLSHGGKVALATVLPIVGVIAIVAALAYYISRRSNASSVDSNNNSAVWWRRPFARSGGSASPIAGSSSSV